MVGVGVYCSRAHVFGGRATRFAANSILSELSKLVKAFFSGDARNSASRFRRSCVVARAAIARMLETLW